MELNWLLNMQETEWYPCKCERNIVAVVQVHLEEVWWVFILEE